MSMPVRPALLAVAFAAALAAPSAYAQWKWKDASGIVQYSDLPPPPGIADRDILQRPAPAAMMRAAPQAASAATMGASGAARGVDPELEARRKKAEQDEAARKKADEDRAGAARADNCARARGNLKALDDGLRMARLNAKGEREVLDDQARAEESRRTRAVIASDCK
jgi:hypothetical protein